MGPRGRRALAAAALVTAAAAGPRAHATVPVPVPVGAVPTPTSLTVFGDSLYVASWNRGIVFRFLILPGGALSPPLPYATGFRSPLGVAFAPDGTMFVADSHPAATPERQTAGRVWAVAPGGARSIVIDELPNGNHNTNGMAVLGGRLFIANGNSTDDGVTGLAPEMPLSGTLVSVPLGARGLGPDSPEVVVEARGMRNLYDVAFRPGTTEAWIPTNGPDFLEPYGEDTLNVADVAGDAPDFGFPGCVYASNPTRYEQNPVEGAPVCDPNHTPPAQLLGLHVSADGLAFGPPGGIWDGDLFIAEFGNFYGEEVVGHKVVRVPIDAAGNAGAPQDLLRGGVPLDLTFGADGMYVADFGGMITLVRDV